MITYYIFERFIGNYDELESGSFENSALFLSGGLHQQYSITDSINANSQTDTTKNQEDEELVPNTDELLEIIKLALRKKDMIGCLLEDVLNIQLFHYILPILNVKILKNRKKWLKNMVCTNFISTW